MGFRSQAEQQHNLFLMGLEWLELTLLHRETKPLLLLVAQWSHYRLGNKRKMEWLDQEEHRTKTKQRYQQFHTTANTPRGFSFTTITLKPCCCTITLQICFRERNHVWGCLFPKGCCFYIWAVCGQRIGLKGPTEVAENPSENFFKHLYWDNTPPPLIIFELLESHHCCIPTCYVQELYLSMKELLYSNFIHKCTPWISVRFDTLTSAHAIWKIQSITHPI